MQLKESTPYKCLKPKDIFTKYKNKISIKNRFVKYLQLFLIINGVYPLSLRKK